MIRNLGHVRILQRQDLKISWDDKKTIAQLTKLTYNILTMSVSKKKKSRSKTARGRSHQALSKIKLIKCKKCGKSTMPHRVCAACGTYQGKEIIKQKTKKKKPAN